jgi:ABC-type sulfate/molybdate transport systems ATPase subunit
VGGDVLLDSTLGVDVPAERRRLGYVPQDHALFPFLDVAGNVAFGLPWRERRRARVDALLDELGLAALASARPDALSGGERQRVALGRALAPGPRVLLLDEPFASIDEAGRASLQKLVRALIEARRIPAVLVTHHPGEAVALGDRLVHVERGRTLASGDPRALLAPRSLTLTGTLAGPVEPLGDGRARAHLDRAVVEGPADRLEGEAGAPLRLDLA